jgi:hypothetical protein
MCVFCTQEKKRKLDGKDKREKRNIRDYKTKGVSFFTFLQKRRLLV